MILYVIFGVLFRIMGFCRYNTKKSLLNKIIFITGGTQGIGKTVSEEFILRGAKVIMTGDDQNIAQEFINKLRERMLRIKINRVLLTQEELDQRVQSLNKGTWKKGNFESEFFFFRKIDHSKFESCQKVTKWVREKFRYIDVMVNNHEGMTTTKYRGKELTGGYMMINHFSHMYLTDQLLPLLKRSRNSKVINTTSKDHNLECARIDVEEEVTPVISTKESIKYYARSKLANVLFTVSLEQFFKRHRLNIAAFSFSPCDKIIDNNYVFQNGLKHGMSMSYGEESRRKLKEIMLEKDTSHKDTLIYLVCEENEKLKPGAFYENLKQKKMNSLAEDKRYSDLFWNRSVEFIEKSLNARMENFKKVRVN